MTDQVAGGLFEAEDDRRREAAAVRAVEVGARIASARKRLGLTGTELGAAVGLGRDQVSKIEAGRRRVGISELPGLADALGVTVRHLLGQPERPGLALAARLATPAGSDTAQAARRRARRLVEVADLLQRVCDLPAAQSTDAGARVLERARRDYPVEPANSTEAAAQGRELAELTRAELDLGSGPLGDLASLIEQHFAVDVDLSPLGEDTSGLCVRSGDHALIVVSTDFTEGHQRFTTAHELGHHLLGDPREIIQEDENALCADSLPERRVNAFAAHLLMPMAGVESVLQWLGNLGTKVTARSVVGLMEHFRVSRQALLCQLRNAGLISYAESQRMSSDSVAWMIQRYAEVAPHGAAARPTGIRRSPERLLRHALIEAREQRVGLSVVATLLDRPDDDELWRTVMADASMPTDPLDEIEL